MMQSKVKPNYESQVAAYVANGGTIHNAVNSNKVEFNFPISTAGSKQNATLRKQAEAKGLTTYVPFDACEKCLTFERSVKTNACLECDRRRARVKTGLTQKKLENIGKYLLDKNQVISFTSGGEKFVLKVERV